MEGVRAWKKGGPPIFKKAGGIQDADVMTLKVSSGSSLHFSLEGEVGGREPLGVLLDLHPTAKSKCCCAIWQRKGPGQNDLFAIQPSRQNRHSR